MGTLAVFLKYDLPALSIFLCWKSCPTGKHRRLLYLRVTKLHFLQLSPLHREPMAGPFSLEHNLHCPQCYNNGLLYSSEEDHERVRLRGGLVHDCLRHSWSDHDGWL